MNRTKIPWCKFTWNPIVGCSPASTGCVHCYAPSIQRRFERPWGKAHFYAERLDQPCRVQKPARIFLGSMTDLGHETVQPAWRQAIYATIERCPQHTFILLTKRPGPWLLEVPPQVWVGVSIESADFLHRWNVIAQLARPAVRLVSVEPMLGPVSFAGCDRQPDWVIAGPETGPQARPCDAAWLEALAAESPVFFDKRKGDRRREFPQPTQG